MPTGGQSSHSASELGRQATSTIPGSIKNPFMMEVRISRILAPAYGYQPHHKRFKERHSYTYHYLPLPTITYSLFFRLFFFIFRWFPVISRGCDRCWFCSCLALLSLSSSSSSEESPMISSKVRGRFRLLCNCTCLLKNVAIRALVESSP